MKKLNKMIAPLDLGFTTQPQSRISAAAKEFEGGTGLGKNTELLSPDQYP